MKKILRWLLVVLGVLLGLALLSALLFLLIGITIDLSPLSARIESTASSALGRKVEILGDIKAVPNLWPTLELGEIRLGNPQGWPDSEFAHMESARIQLRALPLLLGRVRIVDISARGVSVRLERNARGDVNWDFELQHADALATTDEAEPSSQVDPAAPAAPGGGEPGPTQVEAPTGENVVLVGVEQISLRDLSVVYLDAQAGNDLFEFAIEELSGAGALGEDLELTMRGALESEPYSLWVSTGSLADLASANPQWPIEVELEIAGSSLKLRRVLVDAEAGDSSSAAESESATGGIVRMGKIRAEVALELSGERIDELDKILAVSLPPWGPYGFSGLFASTDQGYYATDVELRVGSSRLTGAVGFENVADPQRFDVQLTTHELQLDDFRLGTWSPATKPASPAPDPNSELDGSVVRSLLSPELLRRFAGDLSVRVSRVRSGRDRLGQGSLRLTLEKGKLEQSMKVKVPGGEVAMEMELKPTAHSVHAQLGLQVDSFDYGILARRIKPETEMRGLVGLEVDLRSRAPSFETLMQHANGRLGFAVFPEEFEAGIIDLWAVNLLYAVTPTIDGGKASKINCAVGLFDVEEGRMRQHAVFLDTSRMEVRGDTEVDFHDQVVKAVFIPQAKEAQFLSLATPVRVDGHFSEFSVGVSTSDLIGTVVSFVTDIVVVPIRRLVEGEVPEDGSEQCRALIRSWTDGPNSTATSAATEKASPKADNARKSRSRGPRRGR